MKTNDKETLSVAEAAKAVLEGKKIKTETEVQKANKDFVDLHAIDKKKDPEQEKQTEEKDDDFEEGNAFGQAVTDAKKAGKKKFTFQGKEYNVESVELEEMFNRLKPDSINDQYGELELKYRSSADIRSAENALKDADINVRRSDDTLEIDSKSPAFKKAKIHGSMVKDEKARKAVVLKVLGESTDLEEATELFKKGKIALTKFVMGKGKGLGLQINYGTKFIQIPEKDVKQLYTAMVYITKSVPQFKESVEVEEVELEEAKGFPESSQGAKATYDAVVKLSASLRKGSQLNKAVNKRLGGKYDSDFVKMEKAITVIFDTLEELDREYQGFDESVNEAIDPRKFVLGGDTKTTKRDVDSILSKIFINAKLAKQVEDSEAYKAGYKAKGEGKNPYKKDTADFHLYILGQQSAQSE